MYIVCVTILVKPEFVTPFLEASLDNARNTRQEPGNVRFDVLRSDEDPTQFFLYEAYHAREDHAKHHQTEHYLRWKNKVTDWMRQPRVAMRYTSVFFDNSEQ